MADRMTWEQITEHPACKGRWVAIEECAFGEDVREGAVVDADENLATLCSRLRDAEMSHCAIVFCPDQAHAA